MKALLIVDVQHDFLPNGALGVTDGDQILPHIEQLADQVDLVYASRDWHPEQHISFVDQGGIWPPHCIAGTHGAELHPRVAPLVDKENIIDKATTQEVDAYSAFDNTDLVDRLRAEGVDEVIVVGLATDYCVKATALDAVDAGFTTQVNLDGCRAVNVNPEDCDKAVAEMTAKGIIIK